MSFLDAEAKDQKENAVVKHKRQAEELEENRPEKAAEHYLKACLKAIELHKKHRTSKNYKKIAVYLKQQAEEQREKIRSELESQKEQEEEISQVLEEEEKQAFEGEPDDLDSLDQNQDGSSTDNSASGGLEDPPDVDFSDIGGHEDVKNTLKTDIIQQLKADTYREDLDVDPASGVLLEGPPGTGKSMLAKAVASELGFNFAKYRASDIVTKWMGDPARNLREEFEEAKENTPCVLVFDDIDALARDREEGDKNDSQYGKLQEFLEQMDSIQETDEEILVIGTTNRLNELDNAIVRRFDERMEVPLPDKDTRKEIFKVHLSSRAVDQESIKWEKLLEFTEGFTGSDIENAVEKAARKANIESEKQNELQPITYRHLVKAISEMEGSTEYWRNYSGQNHDTET